MRGFLRALWRDESGQGLAEYALIIALVAIAVIAALVLLRGRIGNIFDRISNALDRYPTTGGN